MKKRPYFTNPSNSYYKSSRQRRRELERQEKREAKRISKQLDKLEKSFEKYGAPKEVDKLLEYYTKPSRKREYHPQPQKKKNIFDEWARYQKAQEFKKYSLPVGHNKEDEYFWKTNPDLIKYLDNESQRKLLRTVLSQRDLQLVDKFDNKVFSQVNKLKSQDGGRQYVDEFTLTGATQLNNAFDFAATKYGGSSQYAMNLSRLLQQLEGVGYIPKANDTSEYFTIDSSYDGNMNELFKHITFKKLPPSDKVKQIVEKIMENDLSSPENYEKAQEKIRQNQFKTLTANLGIDTDKYNSNAIDMLYSIMQSSAAWDIAAEGAYDSDQAKENWNELYESVEKVVTNAVDDTILDKVLQMIENEDSLSNITSFVDDAIYKMLGE